MKVLEVIRRLFLLPWAFLRPSGLPRCPRCKEELDAHNDHEPEACEQRCETCEYAGSEGWLEGRSITYCFHRRKLAGWRPKTGWCRRWAPRDRKEAPHDCAIT